MAGMYDIEADRCFGNAERAIATINPSRQESSDMVKIWGRANSNNVKKVLWCAEELQIPYQRMDAGGAYGIVYTAAFGEKNPNRRVPVLEDEGLVLWESNSIVRYLAARYGAGTLYSADPAARALADRWMDWSSITFAPPFVTVFWNLVRVSPDQRDHAAIQPAVNASADILRVADAVLATQPFLSGPQFGMGDIPLGCLIHAWFHLDIARPELTHISRWYERLLGRPAYKNEVAVPLS
jgi:glutathione S-transferase